MQARRNRKLFLIDLSVPRNIDPAAGGLDNVSLYNTDELKAIARQRELAACHRIIDAHVTNLMESLDPKDESLIV
jgi:glutamyl-tRNA reductase